MDGRGGTGRTGRWAAIPGTVDRTARTVSAQVTHFSAFQFADGSPLTDAFVPGVDEWQVSGFTGSLAYTVPLAAPEGPAGLRPDLRLAYNSAQTDGASGERPLLQAGWAGKGWSLDPGAIALMGTPGGPAGYTLVLGGRSYTLYRGASLVGATGKASDYDWKTSDEDFLRVRAEYLGEADPAKAGGPGGQTFHRYKWHLWTKTGLHYEFAEDAWWGIKYCGTGGAGAYGWMEQYTWKLSRVTDPHGNVITYTYDRTPPVSAPGNCAGLVGTVDVDIWPTAVTWGGPACVPTVGASLAGCHQMRFTSTARTYDAQAEPSPVQLGAPPTQTRVLLAVDVYAWPTGVPSPETAAGLEQNRVRSYYLGYADGTSVPTVLSDTSIGNGPDPTTPKYTLTSVTLVGRDGLAAPATTFAYGTDRGVLAYPNGDWNRLTHVENGQGGGATFAYQSVAADPASPNALFNNHRRVVAKSVSDGRTPASVWGYRYTNPELNTVGRAVNPYVTPDAEPQYLPNAASLYLNRFFIPGAVSDDFNSARPTHSEFRGHRTVTAIAPNGRRTVHTFYQGDTDDDPRAPLHGCVPDAATVNGGDVNTYLGDPCFLLLRDNEFRVGRAYRTEVRGTEGEGSPLLSRVERTYDVVSGAADLQGISPNMGVWHAWVRQTTETTTVFEGGETSPSKTTTATYGYDPAKQGAGGAQYGHLTDVQVFEGVPGPNGTPYRMSQRWYAANDTATAPGTAGQPTFADAKYLAAFAWQSVRTDGAGAAVTKHQTTYDGLPLGQVGAKGESTRVRAFYDLGGNLGRDEAFTHDTYGNVATVATYPQANGGGAARTTAMTHDPVFHSRLTGVTLPSVGGIALTEGAEYDPVLGVLTKITDPNGAITTATYDGLGRITATVAPGGSAANPTVRYLYRFGTATAPGRVATVSSVGTYALRFLDGRGRAIQAKTLVDTSGTTLRSTVADTGYDAMGAIERSSQPRYASEGEAAFWEYTPQADAAAMRWTVAQRDVRGRVTRSTAPDGSYGTASYAVGSLGFAAIVTDANRHQTRREEDVWGRLRLVVEYLGDGAGAAYAAYATTQYGYDVADRLVREEDDRHNVATHTYDGRSHLLSTVDADRGTTVATYDPNGNVQSTVDADMHTIGYGYDALNRLVSESGGVTATYLWDRDPAYPNEANALGRLVTTVSGPTGNPTARTHTTYDARGRKVTAGATIRGVDAGFDYAYDDGNRVITLTYPQAAGATGREAVTYTYDLASRPLSLCAGSTCYAGNAGYTALSQPTARTAGNGVTEQWTYDGPLARLARHQIGTSPQSPSALDDRGYEYDAGGNVTKIVDNLAVATPGQPRPGQQFAYDAQDRLVHAGTVGASSAPYDETYSYDTVGDLTAKAGVAYDYAGSGHAHAPKSVDGDAYTYDAAGNTLTGGGRTYEWNAQGLPTKVTVGGGTSAATPTPGAVPNLVANRGGATVAGGPNLTANRAGTGGTTTPAPNLTAPGRAGTGVLEEYGYDAGGARVWRAHEGIVTLYFGLVEVDVTPNTTVAVATRAFYRFGGVVAQRERKGSTDTVAYLHGDHLGSVGVVTGAGGSLVSRTEYGPWGQVRANSTGTKPTTIDYTGQLRDGTGLLYYGARYYDPVLGRFLSADTVRDGMNPYAYVHNNPLRFTDPTGHLGNNGEGEEGCNCDNGDHSDDYPSSYWDNSSSSGGGDSTSGGESSEGRGEGGSDPRVIEHPIEGPGHSAECDEACEAEVQALLAERASEPPSAGDSSLSGEEMRERLEEKISQAEEHRFDDADLSTNGGPVSGPSGSYDGCTGGSGVPEECDGGTNGTRTEGGSGTGGSARVSGGGYQGPFTTNSSGYPQGGPISGYSDKALDYNRNNSIPNRASPTAVEAALRTMPQIQIYEGREQYAYIGPDGLKIVVDIGTREVITGFYDTPGGVKP